MMLLFFFISYFLTIFISKINFRSINIFFQQKIYFLSLSIIISCIFFFQNNYIVYFLFFLLKMRQMEENTANEKMEGKQEKIENTKIQVLLVRVCLRPLP